MVEFGLKLGQDPTWVCIPSGWSMRWWVNGKHHQGAGDRGKGQGEGVVLGCSGGVTLPFVPNIIIFLL